MINKQKYVYSAGHTVQTDFGDYFPHHSIDQNFASSDEVDHEGIIKVYGKTPELRDLIIRLLNEHEETLKLRHETEMHYTQLKDAVYLLEQANPWLTEEDSV